MSRRVSRRAAGRTAGRSARAARAITPTASGRLENAALVPRPKEHFARGLRYRLLAPVNLEITDNTYTMISFCLRSDGYRVRLHHMFLNAPDHIISRLAGYIRGDDSTASAVLDEYIHENRSRIRRVPPVQRQRRLPLQTRGRVHDLAALLTTVRKLLPEVGGNVAIAWAPAPRVRLPRKSIKLGSYSADTRIIRIHPALDQPSVPEYFVRWIIFHELLHHHFRSDLLQRRGRIHTPEFRKLEQTFPKHADALRWEKQNLDMLLWWDPVSQVSRLPQQPEWPAPRSIRGLATSGRRKLILK